MTLSAAAITLARTLNAGAPLFVVGESLPVDNAIHFTWENATHQLREHAVPGASVITLGSTHLIERDRLLRRCPAWGVNAIWIGSDNAPLDGQAIRIDSPDANQTLTAVLSETEQARLQPELLIPSIVDCTDEVCVTCSDEGRIGEIVSVPNAPFMPAVVRTADGIEEVDVTLVGDVREHDLILIHAGGAIARIEEVLA